MIVGWWEGIRGSRFSAEQIREEFTGTESELNEYIQQLEYEGCFGIDID